MKTTHRIIGIATLGLVLNSGGTRADGDDWAQWNATWDQWPPVRWEHRPDRWDRDRRWERRWRQEQRLRRRGATAFRNHGYYDPFPFDRYSRWGWSLNPRRDNIERCYRVERLRDGRRRRVELPPSACR